MFTLKSKRLTATIIGGLVVGLVTVPVAVGQLGGVPVIDIAALAKMGEELTVALDTYKTATELYTLTNQQYKAFLLNVKSLGSKSAWLTGVRSIGNDGTKNTFGETTGMPAALNGLSSPPYAWRTASVSPGIYLGYLAKEVPGESPRLAHLATVEMYDSAAMTSIQTLGDYRMTDQENLIPLRRLFEDVQDTSASYNSEAAQLNLANAASLQVINNLRQSNILTAAELEEQVVANKFQRDSAAAHIRGFGELGNVLSGDSWKVDSVKSTAARRWLVP